MSHSILNKLSAAFVFAVTIVVYTLTLGDTVVFWDVGEFIAASYLLQVPHPPGAPLFLLVGKLFSMVPFAADPAVRVHFVSALCSALTAVFLYFTIVKLILIWKEKPESVLDKFALYGSAIIGALSLTFSPTFWFNAVEAEVYGVSMLFVGAISYLTLRWNERADNPTSDKYILLIAYLIGLSLGVHLLALLVLFPFLLVFYFRRYEFSLKSFMIFGIVAVGIFGIVYPGIVKMLPNLLDGEIMMGGKANRSVIWTLIPIAAVIAGCYGVYYTHIHKKKFLNTALLSFLLIVLGYSTYTMVIIRANSHTPMNENDPSTLGKLVSYLNREQYGDAPLMERRYSNEPQHQGMYTKYSSDSQFFWQYQMDHMFLRYFLWQYVGIEGDWQDAGVDWKKLWGIPLLMGFFGLYYHFKKDRKLWFVFFIFFLLMGLILAFYFNMQEPQPRERDYFYVGSFFIFSVWIGIGVYGLVDMVKAYLTNQKMQTYAAGAVLLLSAAFIPGNMFRLNYKDADRSGDFVAWDYSYNLLQTCEPDAILFTNGDNDTFPLWYLQDVEGVRRDIRIVNLSLVNTPWYVTQLKNETPHGAKKVPISLSDAQIENLQPMQWEPREMWLDVPRTVSDNYSLTGDAAKGIPRLDTSVARSGKIRFTFPNTITFGNIKAIRVQDIMAYDIITTNRWQRPIYFAVTSTPDSKIGLDRYFRMDGLALKMVPVASPSDEGFIIDSTLTANIYNEPKEPSKDFLRGYRYRGLQDSTVYYDENVRRLTMNYRNAFLRLALYHLNITRNNGKAIEALDSMEAKIPHRVIEMDHRLLYDVANFYKYAGAEDRYQQYSSEVEKKLESLIATNPKDPLTQYNPYTLLLAIYEGREDFQRAIDILKKIDSVYAGTPGLDQQIKSRISQLQAQLALKEAMKKDTVAAKSPAKK